MDIVKTTIDKIQKLDRNKIHILYFSYDFRPYNIYHYPLILATKLLSLIKRKPDIDHVCHISRFVYDRSKKKYNAKIFEANTRRGMEENDLLIRLKNFHGKCYIETLGKVDKQKAKAFEIQYKDVPYSMHRAFLSGIYIKNLPAKDKGGFCSWLVSLFLQDQGYKLTAEAGAPHKISPIELYCCHLGTKKLFYNN